MKKIKQQSAKIVDCLKQFASSNYIEILFILGAAAIFWGFHMIYVPLAFITLGLLILLFAFLAYRNR